MLFICWAWWDSTIHNTWSRLGSTTLYSNGHSFTIVHAPALLSEFEYSRERINSYGFSPPLVEALSPYLLTHEGSSPPVRSGYTYRKGLQDMVNSGAPGTFLLRLPYWFILLCFLPVWGLLLLLRARRLKRAAISTLMTGGEATGTDGVLGRP
ncbi:hypothetical protein OKA04_24245 [Luteolibacter flavescens]|uniref:Uncharacterized protein n=1 Tax=Luteolibacter flavescens TaxID=1859460 RepID=A0ABT3FXA2_9BACT|nr:hypothetical protein [Luteolibacter flavescens]MCW1887871.1 hypothetical protein [Luteolibacter flavescens]